MYKTKLIASILLIAAVLFAQVGIVAAAPPAQDGTLQGTIQTVDVNQAEDGTITVDVTYTDAQGALQTVTITEAGAVALGLFQTDPGTGLPLVDPETGLPLVDDSKVGTDVTFDPLTVVPDEATEEEAVHPISAMLASFFGVSGSEVDQLHQDGFGFGLIAQALWMTKNIGDTEGGDAELATCILEAKRNKAYDQCGLDYGDDPVPTNWGQFKKVFSEKKNNLGFVVSRKGQNETTDPTLQKEHGSGKDNNNGKGKDNNNGKGKP